MNSFRPIHSKVLTLALQLVCFAGIVHLQASDSGHVFIAQEGPPLRNDLASLREVIASLDSTKLRPTTGGSWEDSVIRATLRGVSRIMVLPINTADVPQHSTSTTSEGDILIARWGASNDESRVKAVWLWDSPFYSTFVLEVPKEILGRDSLAQFCETLFLWEQDPIQLRSMRLKYVESLAGSAGEAVIGRGEHIRTAKDTYHIWLQGNSDRSSAYLAVGLSKLMFPGYPVEAMLVKERFPQLRHRLGVHSREQLFAELGKGDKTVFPLLHPWNRDAIVLRELVSRNEVTADELRRVLIDSRTSGTWEDSLSIQKRLTAFFWALNQNEIPVARYAPALERVFLDAKVSPKADFLGSQLFRAMEGSRVNFSKAAIAFLEQEKFVVSSLVYLRTHTEEEELLNKIVRLRVPPEFEQLKEHTIEGIRRGIRSRTK